MENLTVPFSLVSEKAQTPCYAHAGDAGLDLHSTVSYTLKPFERATIPCGCAFAIPEGFAGLVIPRSGLASKHGISIVNAPGLIDSGYRGEIKVVLINLDSEQSFSISAGDRIAQLMIVKIPTVMLQQMDSLDPSERGDAGFGSSGV